MKSTRRGFFGLLAGLACAPALPAVARVAAKPREWEMVVVNASGAWRVSAGNLANNTVTVERIGAGGGGGGRLSPAEFNEMVRRGWGQQN